MTKEIISISWDNLDYSLSRIVRILYDKWDCGGAKMEGLFNFLKEKESTSLLASFLCPSSFIFFSPFVFTRSLILNLCFPNGTLNFLSLDFLHLSPHLLLEDRKIMREKIL